MNAAEINAETAVALLDLAQNKAPGADAQTLGAIGAGYAILAAADRMAVLVESLETLAATVDGLAAAVDAMAAPRPRWWHRLTAWGRTLAGNAVWAAERVAETTAVPLVEEEQAAPAPPVRDALVITGPWTEAQS